MDGNVNNYLYGSAIWAQALWNSRESDNRVRGFWGVKKFNENVPPRRLGDFAKMEVRVGKDWDSGFDLGRIHYGQGYQFVNFAYLSKNTHAARMAVNFLFDHCRISSRDYKQILSLLQNKLPQPPQPPQPGE